MRPTGESVMPLLRWTCYRQTRAQKKKALQMLALSGVVRPSTIELRYTASPSHSIELPAPEQPNMTQTALANTAAPAQQTRGSDLTYQLYSTAFALLAESRRCLQKLQWDNRTAA